MALPLRSRLSLPFDGARLRTLRERRGLRQADLAQRCTDQGTSVSRFQVVRAETGKNMPTPATLAAFARALEIEIDDLLTPDESLARETVAEAS